ncbi:MAG: PmbA protein, partial [Acidobacteriaceae bacterium]|nr:PmbA protein [Acidobacteriaceae bacterium]
MKTARLFSALFFFASTFACGTCAFGVAAPVQKDHDQKEQTQKDNDQTLRAMHDEMERSKTRLELKIPGTDKPVRPYYVEYRLLDLDFREVSGEFGTLLNSNHSRSRFMNVEARVGSYKLDSSNFISEDGFRGFIGSTGSVGIDRDYDSLRQDLWIATDQAFKE